MQKARLQILLDYETLTYIHNFMREHSIRNESRAIIEMTHLLDRLQRIIASLERQSNESAIWKERAEAHLNPKEVLKLNTTPPDTPKEIFKSV